MTQAAGLKCTDDWGMTSDPGSRLEMHRRLGYDQWPRQQAWNAPGPEGHNPIVIKLMIPVGFFL